MSNDLDFRPEALDVGDELRWMNVWHSITRRRITATSVVFDLEAEDGTERTVFYRPGCWVAARPIPREATA